MGSRIQIILNSYCTTVTRTFFHSSENGWRWFGGVVSIRFVKGLYLLEINKLSLYMSDVLILGHWPDAYEAFISIVDG